MNKLRIKPKTLDPKKEIQTIEDEYLILSVEFEAKLFATELDEKVTYKALFEEYAIRWYKWCSNAISSFKYVHPDPHTFFEEYKPLI